MSFFPGSTPPSEDKPRISEPEPPPAYSEVMPAPLFSDSTPARFDDPPPAYFDPGGPPRLAAEGEDGTTYAWEEPPPRSNPWPRVRRLGVELVQTLFLALLLFFAVRGVAQNFRVEGSSMEPGLHNGQYLLVNKAIYYKLNMKTLSKYIPFIEPGDEPERYLFHGPRRGDVVVFRFPGDTRRDFIKRIIGVPGDTVEVRSGTVYVNGVALSEDYIAQGTPIDHELRTVPPKNYFVLGDNRLNSSDSRTWGFVPEGNIIGKAALSYWPLDNFGGVGNRSLNLGVVKLPLP